MELKTHRFVWMDTFVKNDTIWKYKRAPEGMKFILQDAKISTYNVMTGSVQIYNGHVESDWNAFPDIFNQDTIGIVLMHSAAHEPHNHIIPLNNWECKEFTMSAYTTSDPTIRLSVIVFFYLVPMTKAEMFEYAVKQPRYKYRHGSSRTLDRFEE